MINSHEANKQALENRVGIDNSKLSAVKKYITHQIGRAVKDGYTGLKITEKRGFGNELKYRTEVQDMFTYHKEVKQLLNENGYKVRFPWYNAFMERRVVYIYWGN